MPWERYTLGQHYPFLLLKVSMRSLMQPKLVHGPHSLALSYAPHLWKQTPKPPSAPWGQQTPSPLQSRLLSKGTGGKGHTVGSRAGDQGTPKPTRVHPTASLHLLLGPAKEAVPPATGPPGALSVSQRPRKGCKTVPNSVPVG